MRDLPVPADKPTVLMCKWQHELAAALLDLPVSCCLVLDGFDRRAKPDEELLRGFSPVYNISSFDSLEELAGVVGDLVANGVGIDHVVSHHEFSQLGATYLDRALRGGHDLAPAIGQRDKRVMKARVRARGVRTADFVSLSDRHDAAGVRAAADRLGFPVVLKPAAGFGTMNTVRVDNLDELTDTLGHYSPNPLIRSKQLIIEEFVSGREVCVDALWHAGECLTFVVHRYLQPKLAVADRGVPRAVVVDGSYVLDPNEFPDLHRRLREMQASVNGALDIRDGATHMEVFVRPDGDLVFGEIANRIGGMWIPMMLTEHFGQDVWRMLAEAQVFGCPPTQASPGTCIGGANIRPAVPGVVSRVPSPQELAAVPGIRGWSMACAVGSRALLANPAEHYLLLALAAETAAGCAEAFERLPDQVRIEVE